MKVEIREIEDRKATILLSDTTAPMVNAIRRYLMSEIPKMAIQEVEFHLGPIRDEEGNEYESMSPMFDEIVAQRLGMVPIPTDLSLFVTREECSCDGEGCPNCTIMYALNKKGPCTVYSGDLEPIGSAKFGVVDDLIPIVKLDKGQAMLIYAHAILGKGKDHIKWQVTTGVGYKNYPIVDIDNKKCDMCGDCIKMCPPKILEEKGKKLIVTEVEKCILCKTCEEICEVSAITTSFESNRFLMNIETDGTLTAKEALSMALSGLEDYFDTIKEAVSTIG